LDPWSRATADVTYVRDIQSFSTTTTTTTIVS
jgi:hypothetical protein